MEKINEVRKILEELYGRSSKHASYQSLPDWLAEMLDLQFEINEEWRGDRPRYPLMLQFIKENGAKSLIDFGANTGFFSLSLGHDLPDVQVTACEITPTHAGIIRLLAELGKLPNLSVREEPLDMAHMADFGKHDVALHLNILHHAGHDFDRDLVPDRAAFQPYAINYLREFRQTAKRMIFQMGYDWGGNKALPLVSRDDQAGKVEYTWHILDAAGWHVEYLGLARREGGMDGPTLIEAFPPDALPRSTNDLDRWLNDRYGDTLWSTFYQRPIWFCRH